MSIDFAEVDRFKITIPPQGAGGRRRMVLTFETVLDPLQAWELLALVGNNVPMSITISSQQPELPGMERGPREEKVPVE